MATQYQFASSDAGVMARYFLAANFSPNGFNFEQWKDDEFRGRPSRRFQRRPIRKSSRPPIAKAQ